MLQRSVVLIFSFFLLISFTGCIQNTVDLEHYGSTWMISQSSLAEVGVNISDEPVLEIHNPEMFDDEENLGYVSITYGELSSLFYNIYVHSSEQSARSHYQGKIALMETTFDSVLDRKTY